SALSLYVFFFCYMTPRPPSSTLFPYTTLFRSLRAFDSRWGHGGELNEVDVVCVFRHGLGFSVLPARRRIARAVLIPRPCPLAATGHRYLNPWRAYYILAALVCTLVTVRRSVVRPE